MPGTRKLGKTTDQRMAMLRQQVTDFLDQFPDALYLAFRGNGVLGFIHSVIPSTGHAVFSPVLHFLFHTPEHVLEREVVLDFRAQPHFFLPAVLFFR